MRLPAWALLAAFAQTPTYPPPYPREGTTSLIDNARVQVWDVSWPRGKPSPLHRHLYDMTGIYYFPGDRTITAVDGSKRQITTSAGAIQWQLRGITHIEEGTSVEPLRAVMVELKGDGWSEQATRGQTPSRVHPAADPAPAFTGRTMPLLDNDRVTVWDYSRQQAPQRHSHPMDTVVVWTEERKGHAVFVPAGTIHTDEPTGSAAKATIFELKAAVSSPDQDIRAMETLWNDARARADIATLDRILADDWTVTHANGTTDTKATYLADLRSGARTFAGAVTVGDFSVRFYGDTAVAAGSSDSTVTLNGQPQGGKLHFTRVYVKRDGAWKMVVSQATAR